MKTFYALGAIVVYVVFMNWLTGERYLIGNRIRNAIKIFKDFKKATIKAANF
jgi:hypothetical protein